MHSAIICTLRVARPLKLTQPPVMRSFFGAATREVPSPVTAPVVHHTAASLRALGVSGVVKFVESLGVKKYSDAALKLCIQDIDGAALLGMTKDDLLRCGITLGCTAAILRAIAPAVAEMQQDIARAALEASTVTLTVFPLVKKGASNHPVKIKLTPT